MITYGKWEGEWKAKLSLFEQEIKKKTGRPVDKVTSDMTSYRQLGEGFKALDAKFKALEDAPKTEKTALLSKALGDFKGEISKATAKGKLITGKIAKTKRLLQDVHPATGPAHDLLSDTISACIASAESAHADYDKDLAKLSNKWSLFSSKESRDLKELLKFREMLKKRLINDIRSTLLWMKEQERSPNAQAFNDGVEKETYNIYRYMNEYRARCKDNSEEYKLVDAAIKPVERWKNSKTVAENAGGDKVIVALANLKKLLQEVLTFANRL